VIYPRAKTILTTAILFILFIGSGCATVPGPGIDKEATTPSRSKTVKPRTPSSSKKGAEVDLSSNRKGYRLMSSVRDTLDTGQDVDLKQAERLIERVPDSSYGRFLAGLIYLHHKDTDSAKIQFIRSSELDPGSDHALSALGNIALEAGDLTGADLYYSKAHQAAATPVTANRLALLRIQGGYLESAKEILSKSLADYPGDIPTLNNLAIALDMMGKTSEGINILAGDEIADPQLLRTRALLQMKEGRPDQAVLDLEAGFESGGSGGEWLLLGTADLQRGRLPAAEDKFRSAIVAQPSDYEGYLNLGLTLRRLGNFTEAEEIYQQGLATASHPDLHLNLGVLYELYRGKPSLALEQYRKYLELEGPASDRVRGWMEYLEGIVENL
jgi:tetratricopeptide (TPR) repeat protein